nr:uncharacterized protein LOC127298661 [Lolium perenne]
MPPFLDAEADGGRLEERSPAEDLSEEGPDLLHLRLPRLRLRLLVGCGAEEDQLRTAAGRRSRATVSSGERGATSRPAAGAAGSDRDRLRGRIDRSMFADRLVCRFLDRRRADSVIH